MNDAMYTEQHIAKTIATLHDLVHDPIKVLESHTNLSRTTIQRFLRRDPIKPANTAHLFEICLDVIEKHQQRQQQLTLKYKRIIQKD
ncbi:HD domain-containing protein [Aquimarina sp. TRL1]|uniref:HD domain-containing protein n=1 Tax=Aquimarina sp. (strain TRL1) TaxID=2736252 RepID=UPI00158D6B7B|nr:HD domain-containing protein [Aquimarina sp. TRL1]QKX05336.1 HD domain-containing protein [Aquimarina sp. TRL1]